MTTFNRKLAFAAAIAVAGFAGAAQAQDSIAYSTAHSELETGGSRWQAANPYNANAMFIEGGAVSPSRVYTTHHNEFEARNYGPRLRQGLSYRQDRSILDAEIRDSAWRD